MGTMPVNRLLLTMSLPMMISMLIQALYNVVDSLFVARVSQDALTAVSLCFPVQSLVVAVAVGTGVGVNALLSRSLGEKNFDEANRAANNGVMLVALSYLAFLLFGLFLVEPFFATQTDNAAIREYGTQYLSICIILSFGQMLSIIFERLLVATGRTVLSMISQATGAIVNIVLDPVLIFGLGPFPELGVRGAAIATVAGQLASMCIAVTLNLKLNHDIRISFSRMRFSSKTVKEIYRVGVPSILMQSITSFMTFFLNRILLSFDTTAGATAFGIYFKLQSFVFMPVFGLNNGMVPIVAYNYGARRGERMKKTIALSAVYAVSYMLLCLAVVQLFPSQILTWFDAKEELMRVGIPALRILSLPFVVAGISIVFISVFQSLGSASYSLVISVARQLVVLLPAAWLLSKISLDAVWWSFPIAEVASALLAVIFFVQVYARKIAPLCNNRAETVKNG